MGWKSGLTKTGTHSSHSLTREKRGRREGEVRGWDTVGYCTTKRE